jgi:hypothetical protein
MEQSTNGVAYQLRADVVATVLDHGALLLDLESKYFYLLNPSGWAVAQLFEDGATVDHALERSRAWGAAEADLDGVRDQLQRMAAERLLEPASMPLNSAGEGVTSWEPVSFERQPEPLQRVIVSAFDPSIPLAE